MNERHIQLEESRESYFAPTYCVFSFETSDLLQTSEPTVGDAYLGSDIDKSDANGEWYY